VTLNAKTRRICLTLASLCWASDVWCCPHLLLSAGACVTAPSAVDRYLLPAGRSTANPPAAVAAVGRWDRCPTVLRILCIVVYNFRRSGLQLGYYIVLPTIDHGCSRSLRRSVHLLYNQRARIQKKYCWVRPLGQARLIDAATAVQLLLSSTFTRGIRKLLGASRGFSAKITPMTIRRLQAARQIRSRSVEHCGRT